MEERVERTRIETKAEVERAIMLQQIRDLKLDLSHVKSQQQSRQLLSSNLKGEIYTEEKQFQHRRAGKVR